MIFCCGSDSQVHFNVLFETVISPIQKSSQKHIDTFSLCHSFSTHTTYSHAFLFSSFKIQSVKTYWRQLGISFVAMDVKSEGECAIGLFSFPPLIFNFPDHFGSSFLDVELWIVFRNLISIGQSLIFFMTLTKVRNVQKVLLSLTKILNEGQSLWTF